MKTASEAIRNYRKMGISSGIVFQYPRGHWSACTIDSPNGKAIAANGMTTIGIPVTWRYFS